MTPTTLSLWVVATPSLHGSVARLPPPAAPPVTVPCELAVSGLPEDEDGAEDGGGTAAPVYIVRVNGKTVGSASVAALRAGHRLELAVPRAE